MSAVASPGPEGVEGICAWYAPSGFGLDPRSYCAAGSSEPSRRAATIRPESVTAGRGAKKVTGIRVRYGDGNQKSVLPGE